MEKVPVGRVKASEILAALERLEPNSAIETVVRHYGTETRLLVCRAPAHIEDKIYVVFEHAPRKSELRAPVLWKTPDGKGFWALKEAFAAERLPDFAKWLAGNLRARVEDLEVEVVSWWEL